METFLWFAFAAVVTLASTTSAAYSFPSTGLSYACNNDINDSNALNCLLDTACFSDSKNFIYGPIEADGSQTFSVQNCIPRSTTSAISFVSVSDCSNSCSKTEAVRYGTTLYSYKISGDQDCTDVCVYVHDGVYKPSTGFDGVVQTSCISDDNQRCNMCAQKTRVCKTMQATTIPTLNPSASPSEKLSLPATNAPSNAAQTAKPTPFATLNTYNDVQCPTNNAAGVNCEVDTSCFADPNNFVYSQFAADGSQLVTIKNCILRSKSTSISFISVSDCSSPCRKSQDATFGQTLYNVNIPSDKDCTEVRMKLLDYYNSSML